MYSSRVQDSSAMQLDMLHLLQVSARHATVLVTAAPHVRRNCLQVTDLSVQLLLLSCGLSALLAGQQSNTPSLQHCADSTPDAAPALFLSACSPVSLSSSSSSTQQQQQTLQQHRQQQQ
jgi:hypothetical protein